MTHNDDGSITLSADDIVGLRALIVAATGGLTDRSTFTSETATQFVRTFDEAEARAQVQSGPGGERL